MEDVATIIGLTVEAGRRYLSKSKNNSLDHGEYSISILQDYFASDGSFKYNERVDRFKEEIDRLEIASDNFREMMKRVADIDYERKPFAQPLTELLIENNKRLQSEVETSSTLTIKRSINEVERVLAKYEQVTDNQDYIWVAVSSSFDHEKAIKPLDICSFLYAIIVSTIITKTPTKAIAECLGMLVHLDYQNWGNTKFYTEKHPKEVKKLLEYFNIDGSFKENPRVKDFVSILTSLLAREFKNNSPLVIPEALESLPKDLGVLLEESNEQYRQIHAENKRTNKQIAVRERVSRYYDNGRVLAIPYLFEEFLMDLHECGFTDEEEARIIRYFDNRMRMKDSVVSSILDEEELQIYLDAEDLLKLDTLTGRDREEIGESIKNIRAFADLLSYDMDKIEREYLTNEKRDSLERLKGVLVHYLPETYQDIISEGKSYNIMPVDNKTAN